LKSHIATEQRRNGFPAFMVEVLEGEPKLHSNIIAPLPRDAAKRIARSKAYSGYVDMKSVTVAAGGMVGLRDYLLKEATPQAAFKKAFRRNKGSHLLEGGGDRVRLSEEFEAALLAEGRIEPYNRTYASRALSPRPISTDNTVQKQIEALPAPTSPPIASSITAPAQLSLQFDVPPVPLLQLVEATRIERGLSQRAVAAKLGMKQPGYSNAVGVAVNHALLMHVISAREKGF
jgi:hypothetical protein